MFVPSFGERLSGLAVVSPVVAFPLPYGIRAFLCSAVYPDSDSSMGTCFMKTSTSEFQVAIKKGIAGDCLWGVGWMCKPLPAFFFPG